jgi:hypothetical protein
MRPKHGFAYRTTVRALINLSPTRGMAARCRGGGRGSTLKQRQGELRDRSARAEACRGIAIIKRVRALFISGPYLPREFKNTGWQQSCK